MNNAPPRLWIVAVTALLGGAGIGYFAGSITRSDESPVDSEDASLHDPRAARATSETAPIDSTMAELLAGNKTPAEKLTLILKQPSGRFRQRQIALLAESIPPKEIPAFLAGMSWASGDDAREVGEALTRRWAEADPMGATVHAQGQDSAYRRGSLDIAAGEWVAQDAARAESWARALPAGVDRDGAVSAIARALSRRDPEAAFRLMTELGSNSDQAFDVQEIMNRWASKAPLAAVAALSQLKGDAIRQRATINLALGWAQSDPGAAFGWGSKMESAASRRMVLPILALQWAKGDPDAALRAAESMPDGLERQLVLGAVAAAIAGADVERALSLVGQIPKGAAQDQSLSRIAGDLAARDPARAAGMVESLPLGVADRAIREIVPRLQNTDPHKAAELALRLGDESSRAFLISNTMSAWLQSAPEAAASWLQGTSVDGRTEAQLSQSLSNWASENAEAAVKLLGSSGNSSGKRGVLWNGLLVGLAKQQPRVAADLALSQPADLISGGTLREVGTQLATTNPGASTTWLMRLPDNDARAQAAIGVASGWASTDPRAPAAWIESLPAGKTRDGAAAGYARHVMAADPGAGLSWAATITAEPLRDHMMSTTLAQWLHKDRAAAEAWLAQNPDLPNKVAEAVANAKAAQ